MEGKKSMLQPNVFRFFPLLSMTSYKISSHLFQFVFENNFELVQCMSSQEMFVGDNKKREFRGNGPLR